MNRNFKPLDAERKAGVVLIVVCITAFVMANYATTPLVINSSLVAGMLSFLSVVFLMAKSVDDNGGWGAGEEGEQPAPPLVPRDYGNDYKYGPRYREFKPLDRERGWGIVVIILTIVAFSVGANTTGWTQIGAMVLGMLSFLGIFVLMGISMDKQSAEERRNRPH